MLSVIAVIDVFSASGFRASNKKRGEKHEMQLYKLPLQFQRAAF